MKRKQAGTSAYSGAIEGLRAKAARNGGGRQQAVDRLTNLARSGRAKRTGK